MVVSSSLVCSNHDGPVRYSLVPVCSTNLSIYRRQRLRHATWRTCEPASSFPQRGELHAWRLLHFHLLHELTLARKSALSPRDNAIIGQRKEVRPPRIQNVFKSPNQHPAPVTPVFRVHTQDISPRYPYIARRNCLARCTHRGHSRYCLWLPPSTRMAQSSLHATRRCTARARS